MIRKPHVAGSFYPSDRSELAQYCDLHLKPDADLRRAKAVLLPHAGYFYSGLTACKVLSKVNVPSRVYLLGPNHRGIGSDVSVYGEGAWHIPTGNIETDLTRAEALHASCPDVAIDPAAHMYEHSLEVLVPLLYSRNSKISLVPIVINTLDIEKAAKIAGKIAPVIAADLLNGDSLIVVSSDMSHYDSDEATRKKDRYALDAIEQLDSRALVRAVKDHRVTMCGYVPVFMLLEMKQVLGITKATLISYSTSAEASGDTSRVVGYAGFVFE